LCQAQREKKKKEKKEKLHTAPRSAMEEDGKNSKRKIKA